MTNTTLVLDLLVVLALVLTTTGALLIKQRRAQRQPQPLPVPSPILAAPAVNPGLHDETLPNMQARGPADDQNAGTVRHVTVVAGAPQQTYALPRGQVVIIGRHSSHGIALMHHAVSRDHARLVFINGAVQITDLGSLNGTFVGKQKQRRGLLWRLLLPIRTNSTFADKNKHQLAPHTPAMLAPSEVFWIGPDILFIMDAATRAPNPATER